MAEARRTRKRPTQSDGEGNFSVHHRISYSGEAGPESGDEGTVRVGKFETEVARVKVHGSITRNMGDFNSVRVEVSCELPALPVVSELDRAYDAASTWVDQKLGEELEKATTEQQDGDAHAQQDVQQGEDNRVIQPRRGRIVQV